MAVCEQTYSASMPVTRFSFKAFLLQSCVNFYTDSGAKVWESCGEMGKGLEGPQKGHPSALSPPERPVPQPSAPQMAHPGLSPQRLCWSTP